jgi:hypothetical protein
MEEATRELVAALPRAWIGRGRPRLASAEQRVPGGSRYAPPEPAAPLTVTADETRVLKSAFNVLVDRLNALQGRAGHLGVAEQLFGPGKTPVSREDVALVARARSVVARLRKDARAAGAASHEAGALPAVRRG